MSGECVSCDSKGYGTDTSVPEVLGKSARELVKKDNVLARSNSAKIETTWAKGHHLSTKFVIGCWVSKS